AYQPVPETVTESLRRLAMGEFAEVAPTLEMPIAPIAIDRYVSYELGERELREFKSQSGLIREQFPGYGARADEAFSLLTQEIDIGPDAREWLSDQLQSAVLHRDFDNMATVSASAVRVHRALLTVAAYWILHGFGEVI